MTEDEQARLAANLAGPLARIERQDIVAKFIAHLHAADPEYGERVENAIKEMRADS